MKLIRRRRPMSNGLVHKADGITRRLQNGGGCPTMHPGLPPCARFKTLAIGVRGLVRRLRHWSDGDVCSANMRLLPLEALSCLCRLPGLAARWYARPSPVRRRKCFLLVRSKNGTGAPSAVLTFAASRACPMIAIRATASGMSAGIPACDYATTGSKGRNAASPTRRSCRATPPRRKKSRIGVGTPTERSRANCACEPDHETDPGVCRNHPLLRWQKRLLTSSTQKRIFVSPHPFRSLLVTERAEEYRSAIDGDSLYQLRRLGRT